MKPNRSTTNACALVLAAALAGEAAGAERARRAHAAHAHGHGTLEVAVQDRELAVELRIPGANVVGFEHPPGSPEEHARVERALETFGDAANVLALTPAAGCTVVAAEVDFAGMSSEGEGHAGEEGDHADEAARSGHEAEHSELHARYDFRCERPNALTALEVRAFPHLPGAERLEARYVTDRAQGVGELAPGRPVLRIDR